MHTVSEGGAFDVIGVELKGNDKAAALTAQRDPTCSLGNGIQGSASADCVHRERVWGSVDLRKGRDGAAKSLSHKIYKFEARRPFCGPFKKHQPGARSR